jgi:cysteine synthase A
MTPLVFVPHLGPRLLAKLELGHASGSMKQRAIPVLLERMLAAGELQVGQAVVVLGSVAGAAAAAWAGARLGARVHALLPRSLDVVSEAALRRLGARVYRVASRDVAAALAALRGAGAVPLDLAGDPRLIEPYAAIAGELLGQAPDLDTVVVGIGSGASITGIGRAIKARRPSCRVIGVEPKEARVASGRPWAPHSIEGLAPEGPQPLLDSQVIDDIVAVPSASAWERSRELARLSGLSAGPSSGAVLEAAYRLQRLEAGTLVAVLAGAGDAARALSAVDGPPVSSGPAAGPFGSGRTW